MKISLPSLMLEQKAKINGNAFLTVKHGNGLTMNHLTASVLPPPSQTTGHRLIQKRSRGWPLLFLHL